MNFFLYEVAARLVAISLCIGCGRKLWSGLLDRRIEYAFTHSDGLDWLLDWWHLSTWVAVRDVTPIRYWIVVGVESFTMLACLVVAIFGWWHPNT